MEKVWQAYPSTSSKNTIRKYLKCTDITARVLVNRGIDTIEKINRFRRCKLEDLHSPFLLEDMQKAIHRVQTANREEQILIYGDYDVDGITSNVILTRALQQLGFKNIISLTSNREQGYGVRPEHITEAKEEKVTLMFLVDVGTTSFHALKAAKNLGIDVIVLDHHALKKENIEAYAFINPQRKQYPFKQLCAAGVVCKFIQALQMSGEKIDFVDYLDYVAMATVADVVPLIDENRIFTKIGLKKLSQTNHLGLKAFLSANSFYKKNITSDVVGFILGPRINAAGRMTHAKYALDMFLTNDYDQALQMAKELTRLNSQRKKLEHQLREEALEIINKEKYLNHKVLILSSDKWRKGIVGIIASVISDMFHRPCIMVSVKDGIGYGSVRNIKKFPLLSSLKKCEKHLIGFGGHAMAAGCLMKEEKISIFRKAINRVADKILKKEDLIPILYYDIKVKLKDLTYQLNKELEELAPFGEGNPFPTFIVEDVIIPKVSVTKDNEHLRAVIVKDKTMISSVGFWMGSFINSIVADTQRFDVLFEFNRNIHEGKEFLQMSLKDIKVVSLRW